jgi:hypothetical protein
VKIFLETIAYSAFKRNDERVIALVGLTWIDLSPSDPPGPQR